MRQVAQQLPVIGWWLTCLVLVCLSMTACDPTPPSMGASGNEPKSASASPPARLAAVAGLFYPKDPGALGGLIDRLLAETQVEPVQRLKALVCPHAGYVYSGPTAAFGYKLLQGRQYETVIVLAPSHYALFHGASVCTAAVYRTPLGEVPISEKAQTLARLKPFVPEQPATVHRPSWAANSSRPAPAPGADTPHTWEHSDEVQVPFLQRVLKQFKLVPVVMGQVDAAEVARVLAEHVDEHTLLIASSDLSHYHPYDQARQLDSRCVKAICDLDVGAMQDQEACGKGPVQVVMHLARLKGWKAKLLDYRNSGDTAGDRTAVVGYAAVAFYQPEPGRYSAAERKALLDLARQTIKEVVTRNRLPEVRPEQFPASLREPKACFVTLTKQGRLRGCIGHLTAQEPLYKAVMENARNAAVQDIRFPPVQPDELAELAIEISVLTEPQPVAFSSPEDLLAKLRPHQDGVILQIGDRRATFLPQVWSQLPDKEQFLNHLAQKAGCSPSDWRKPGTRVQIYQVESFHEGE